MRRFGGKFVELIVFGDFRGVGWSIFFLFGGKCFIDSGRGFEVGGGGDLLFDSREIEVGRC